MGMRCPTAETLATTMLEGYQLLFRGPDGGAVATIEKRKGGNVPVMLWNIEAMDEMELDYYEGYPVLYRKETVTVVFNGKVVEAMAYVMNKGKPKGRPSLRYLNIIKEGYDSAGFDASYLKAAIETSKA